MATATASTTPKPEFLGLSLGMRLDGMMQKYPMEKNTAVSTKDSTRYQRSDSGIFIEADVTHNQVQMFRFTFETNQRLGSLDELQTRMEKLFSDFPPPREETTTTYWQPQDKSAEYSVHRTGTTLTVEARTLAIAVAATDLKGAIEAPAPTILSGIKYDVAVNGGGPGFDQGKFVVEQYEDGSFNINRCTDGDGTLKRAHENDQNLLLGLSLKAQDAQKMAEAIDLILAGKRGKQLTYTERYNFGSSDSDLPVLRIMKNPSVELFNAIGRETPFFTYGGDGIAHTVQQVDLHGKAVAALKNILSRKFDASGAGALDSNNRVSQMPSSQTTSGNVAPSQFKAIPIPAAAATNMTVAFSKTLPEKNYRTESVADFVNGAKSASQKGENNPASSGSEDALGLSELRKSIDPKTVIKGAEGAMDYNRNLKGQPLHYTGSYLKTSNFLGIKSVIIDMGNDLTITLSLQDSERKTMELLKAGDLVEIAGSYDTVNSKFGTHGFTWTLRVDSGEIISIKRPNK